MTTAVILAAGRGTRVGRVGDTLHKCLLPLDGRAVLSHQLDLLPVDAHIVICVGYRSTQVVEYVEMAHYDRDITFVDVPNWNGSGSGPGTSLLAARNVVGDDDMIYMSCDTLWTPNDDLWAADESWAAVAHIPAGSEYYQWCRLTLGVGDDNDIVTSLIDKVDTPVDNSYAYVGLAYIIQHDLQKFWAGIEERQKESLGVEWRDVRGLVPLIAQRLLKARHVEWTDTGTEESYRAAVTRYNEYEWTKTGQVTYVLPDQGRVIKFMADPAVVRRRCERSVLIGEAVSEVLACGQEMAAYEYIPGVTVYSAIDDVSDVSAVSIDGRVDNTRILRKLLTWRHEHLTKPVRYVTRAAARDAALTFYRDKTLQRIDQLSPSLRVQALDAVQEINWHALANGCQPGMGHGDLNQGNIVVQWVDPMDDDLTFTGIDWREDFADRPWIDLRYDLAKLLAGTVVHWDRARHGDFRPWESGSAHAEVIRAHIAEYYPDDVRAIEIIGALSLLNSAPLHAAPLDEILVARSAHWLENIL